MKRLSGPRIDRALESIEGALSWAREHERTDKARNLEEARAAILGIGCEPVSPDPEPVFEPEPEPEPEPAPRVTFVHGSHNLLFRLDAKRWAEDLEKSHKRADVRGLQEAGDRAQRRAVKAHAKKFGLGRFHPKGTATPILFRKDVFEKTAVTRGARLVHKKAGFARYNPGRYLVWLGLRHKETGAKILVLNLHATAGYAKTGKKPWGSRLDRWKDKVARLYWTETQKFLQRKIERGNWDAILVGGDFNARLENEAEDFFPGPMLKRLVIEDDVPRSIDRLVYALPRDDRFEIKATARWSTRKGVHSDHPLHFAKYRIKSK
jgi:hypothetical protein